MDRTHSRLKLEDIDLDPTAEDKCDGKVVVSLPGGEMFTGAAEGPDSPQGQLRCAAEATANALEAATDGRVQLEVLAVRAVDGFDTVIVVVSIGSRVEERLERLVGSCLIKGQPTRGAVLAVLSATNRLVGRVISEAGSEPAL